jgi:hypothetical protein
MCRWFAFQGFYKTQKAVFQFERSGIKNLEIISRDSVRIAPILPYSPSPVLPSSTERTAGIFRRP